MRWRTNFLIIIFWISILFLVSQNIAASSVSQRRQSSLRHRKVHHFPQSKFGQLCDPRIFGEQFKCSKSGIFGSTNSTGNDEPIKFSASNAKSHDSGPSSAESGRSCQSPGADWGSQRFGFILVQTLTFDRKCRFSLAKCFVKVFLSLTFSLFVCFTLSRHSKRIWSKIDGKIQSFISKICAIFWISFWWITMKALKHILMSMQGLEFPSFEGWTGQPNPQIESAFCLFEVRPSRFETRTGWAALQPCQLVN